MLSNSTTSGLKRGRKTNITLILKPTSFLSHVSIKIRCCHLIPHLNLKLRRFRSLFSDQGTASKGDNGENKVNVKLITYLIRPTCDMMTVIRAKDLNYGRRALLHELSCGRQQYFIYFPNSNRHTIDTTKRSNSQREGGRT